jgi:hypothetical protein
MSLAPTNEESAWMGKKTSVRKNNLRVGVAFACVDSVRLLTTSIRLFVERRDLNFILFKKGVTLLMFNPSDLLPLSTLIVPFV